ncbi:ABC transporter permease [Paenibacillus luteus]|uniref:ABC transporter permease n=1 Tax=Paenibacillus luteus TaxID=2545753 RepID=UPI001143555F|nr:ABC transporter permease [Paenibacillus luteus]
MVQYLASRLGMLVLTLLLLTLFVFALMHLAPGDPAALMLQGLGAAPDGNMIAYYQHKWGLDQSFAVQYMTWLLELLQGNLGHSYITNKPVKDEIFSRMGPTLMLMTSSFVLTFLVSVPLGVLTALRERSLLDRVVYGGTVLGLSIPLYWLAIMLMLLFGVIWPLFPIIGGGSLRHYVLPVTTISMIQSVYFIRMIRSFTMESKQALYIEAAAARGLKRRILYPSYLFRAMLIPFITIVGTSFPSFFGSSIIIENVFSFPGIGKYMLDMIYSRDFPVIQGCSLLLASAIFIVHFMTDLCYYLADPRVRLEKQRWEN